MAALRHSSPLPRAPKRAHPGPAGCTRAQKAASVASGSGFVSLVTKRQTIVVTPVVTIRFVAKPRGVDESTTARSVSDVTSADAIAETSLHALTRHQYQRRM